jgi:hypothetical protein
VTELFQVDAEVMLRKKYVCYNIELSERFWPIKRTSGTKMVLTKPLQTTLHDRHNCSSAIFQQPLELIQAEDGGSVLLRNVGTLNHCAVQKLTPRRLFLTTAVKT